MKGFIEISDGYGNRILLNVRRIEEVREHVHNDTCTIYMVSIAYGEAYHIDCKRSYADIVSLIEKAVE